MIPKKKGPVLRPGEIIDLAYNFVDPLYKDPSAVKDQGIFCKLEASLHDIQFRDGTLLPAGGIKYNPTPKNGEER